MPPYPNWLTGLALNLRHNNCIQGALQWFT